MDDFDNELDHSPIDGQLGLEDLYYEMSTKQQVDNVQQNNPIDGQISFDDYTIHNVSSQDSACKNINSTNSREDNVNNILQDNLLEIDDKKANKEELVVDEQTQETELKTVVEDNEDDVALKEVPSFNKQEEMIAGTSLEDLGNIFKPGFEEPKPKIKAPKTPIQQFKAKVKGDYKEKIEEILDEAQAQKEELVLQKLKNEKSNKGAKKVEEFFDDKIENIEQDTQVDGSTDDQEKSKATSNGQDGSGLFFKNLDEVLHESMIPYSEHVIMDRALPRVEDGLKPVQRRILYSMLDLGITPDKPFRKSARIVGDCLGKYHPHGDTSVYDAMVRLAQPFNMNQVLVNGHGNFGSIDGDKAAAMRYTEARLAPLALELLRDLEKDTVKWSLNFDDTIKEPDTLPGRFPNLLVNGAMGIAVGLATNIPPHNLAEVIDGVVAYIDKPTITLKEIMKYIKAPDFPTGGYILASSEIEQAFATGKGKIIMRAKMHIEGNDTDKRSIVITELPYQINKSVVLQKIASLREEGKHPELNGIADIRDESDRNGLRAVIRIKKDANLKNILNSLLKYTDLQCSFGVNMVAIADGKPKQMGLLDIIKYYVEYQREVVLRRTKYDLERTKERLHILEGLLVAIKNIDEVIKIIKSSSNVSTARQRLRDRFSLSERQAQAILDMKLARLTNLEVNNLQDEIKKNKLLVEELTKIVNSKKAQFDVVKTEILAIKKQYKEDRKSIILKSDDIDLPTDTDKETVVEGYIGYNVEGNIKFMNKKTYNSAAKEFKETSTLHEIYKIITKTDSEKTAVIFTNKGNCYKVPVKAIPDGRFRDKGAPIVSVIKCLKDETVCGIFSIDEEMPKGNIVFMTKQGIVKKSPFKEYNVAKSTFQAMKLKDDDEIINVFVESKNTTMLFVTKNGMVLNADKSDVPSQGRISGGVKGINLSDGDYCIFAGEVSEDGEVVVMTNRGFVKRVVISQIDVMARYRKGVKIVTLSEKDNGTELIYADYVKENYVVVGRDENANLYGRDTDVCPIESRTGKGKLIEKIKKPPLFTNGYRYLII